MIQFRHYKPVPGLEHIKSSKSYGFVYLPDRWQPTFDIYFGSHTFVWFLVRRK